jgi:hypothetical protein
MPDGFEPDAAPPSSQGQRWPNGGGWVADEATVEASAYVGQYAQVLGGRVSGNPRIDGRAVVLDANVYGSATVEGLSVLSGGIAVGDSARAATVYRGPGSLGSGQRVEGTATTGICSDSDVTPPPPYAWRP